MKLKKRLSIILQAVLATYALQRKPVPALDVADYKSAMHYIYAQVTNLLGEYALSGMLVFALAVVFLLWMERSSFEKKDTKWFLPFFFSFCLLVGESYAEVGSWDLCFGGVFQAAGFLAAFAGYAILFRRFISLLLGAYQRVAFSQWNAGWAVRFFGKKCFRNVFLLLMLLWLPVLLLSYPGNLCYDCLGQIEQGMGMRPYSTHHPLLHTLVISGIIRVGSLLARSNDLGLFLYLLLQAAALAAALAATVSRLGKRDASLAMRLLVTGVYVLAPMYSNMASTAVKDVPFMAAVIWYILLLEELVEQGMDGRKPLYWGQLVLVQVLVGLLRNNGIYMVALTGVVFACVWGRKAVRKGLTLLLCMAVLPFLVYTAGNGIMVYSLSAEKGSVAEMLSVPFQQTARYLQLYRSSLTAEEREAIEGVLTDVNLVAERYDPDLADPVKALYRKDASLDSLAAYFRVWAVGFFTHPAVYVEAFLAHVYGWFDPGVTNAIRYEAYSELFRQGGLFAGADKLLIFLYRFLEFIPPIALLENVGAYTWLLFILAAENIRPLSCITSEHGCNERREAANLNAQESILAGRALRRKEKKGLLLVPLFVSLLVCMAAPCFYLHPRYAYPIMFTIPFMYGIMAKGEAISAEGHNMLKPNANMQ